MRNPEKFDFISPNHVKLIKLTTDGDLKSSKVEVNNTPELLSDEDEHKLIGDVQNFEIVITCKGSTKAIMEAFSEN